jgi:DNA-binding NarL/FixJ family response regulator
MPDTNPITVATGTFEDLLARGLRGVIEDDSSLSLVAADVPSTQLARTLKAQRPQVTIIDAGSLASPVDVRELAALRPATRLLLLADRPSSVESAQLLAFGASACLAKTTQMRDVLNAIHLASRGLQLAPSEADPPEGRAALLTARETDVLAHLQMRRSNAQIAADLQISVETVRTHARHIYRKLGVRSRRELIAAPAGSARSA